MPLCIFRKIATITGICPINEEITYKIYGVNIITVFFFIISLSILLSIFYRNLPQVFSPVIDSFISYFILFWSMMNYMILTENLNKSIMNGEKNAKHITILDSELQYEKNYTRRSNKWLHILFIIQNNNNVKLEIKKDPLRTYFLLILNLKKDIQIIQYEKDTIRKQLDNENTEHLKTTKLLDTTMRMNNSLTISLYNEKKKLMFFPIKQKKAISPSSLSLKIQCVHWKILADKARNKYYIKRINFFAECSIAYRAKMKVYKKDELFDGFINAIAGPSISTLAPPNKDIISHKKYNSKVIRRHDSLH
jgi:hypothetical protein